MKKAFLAAVLSIFSVLAFCEKISFHADRMTGSTKKNSSDVTTLSGNAAVSTDNMELHADTIEISGKNFRYIKASGNISGKIKDSQMDFTCQNMTYDREKKVAVLQNSVHLVDKKNNVTADAEIIDYSQLTDIAVLQINVVMIQNSNTCTAAHAVYRKKEQTLTMSGNPTVQQGNDKFRAQEIQLNLKTNEITLDGRVRGSVTAESTPAKQTVVQEKTAEEKSGQSEESPNAEKPAEQAASETKEKENQAGNPQ